MRLSTSQSLEVCIFIMSTTWVLQKILLPTSDSIKGPKRDEKKNPIHLALEKNPKIQKNTLW